MFKNNAENLVDTQSQKQKSKTNTISQNSQEKIHVNEENAWTIKIVQQFF